MKPVIIYFIFFFLTFNIATGQNYTITGKVYDFETNLALPFVNIVINDTQLGTTTDIDGKFKLSSPTPVNSIHLSYVGYEPVDMVIGDKTSGIIIKLKRTEYKLSEVVIVPGINPAHRIITNCYNNRDINDPGKLPAYSYTVYDKMYFTLDLDSLEKVRLDTVRLDSSRSKKEDSELMEYLKDHHLFLMESVTKKKFMYPDRSKEDVIATRVSGLKDPVFVFAASMMQSTTFYGDKIVLLDKEYINPISRGSTKKYSFQLEDTLFNDRHDSIFIISFRPAPKKNFDGLKGVISINSNRWAIQNVIAEPAITTGMMSLRIQQKYEFINDEQWFPVQLNTEVILNEVRVSDSTVSISAGDKNADISNEKMIRMPFGFGKSYITDINLHPALKKRGFSNIAVDVDPDAAHRDDDFWLGYRVDSLTQKDKNTYRFVDSISKEANLEKTMRIYESLLTGKIPVWYFDLDIDRFFGYNNFEGFALGAGLHTNDRLSKIFSVGGYFRYGFKDKTFKYGGDMDIMLDYNYDFKLSLFYINDETETSGVPFFDDNRTQLDPENFRSFLVSRMDFTEIYRASVEFQTLKYLKVWLGFSKTAKRVSTGYLFLEPGTTGEGSGNFNFTEASVGLRYAYGEKFVRNIRHKLSLGTNYPIIHFQYTRGIKDVLDGEFEYNRYDFKISKSLDINYVGTMSIGLRAGYIDADIPYTNLYNGHGSYRPFNLYAPGSFSTMRMNEFLSNKYAALYFSHDFGKLLMSPKKWFHPEFAIATNIGFGWLDHKESHKNIDYKTMEKGYYESGILINNLINMQLYSLGIGAFYRYGPYSLPAVADNLSGKFTLTFKF